MFHTGQRVVCIDDEFAPWVFDIYKALPKKNSVYTVRAVAPGRSNPQFGLDDEARLIMTAADFDIVVYLEELHNPDDPHASIPVELGFKGERFAPMDELVETEEAREVMKVGV